MAADLVLDGDSVVLEGTWTKVRTLDLMLDAPSRRITPTGSRRALVHDQGDRLTVNYAGDYPNGVSIRGTTSADSLYVTHQGRFAEGIVTPRIVLGAPAAPAVVAPGSPPGGAGEWGLDVGAAITELEQQVATLKAEVQALQSKLPTPQP